MSKYTFNSLVKEIAENKAKLSISRFQKKEKNEIPREVYLNVCETIAKYYELLGFKYSKSQQAMKLKKGEFTFKIYFQSSRYNIADENVKVIVHASVLSSKLKKWEKESPYEMFNKYPNGYLGGGQIGNLQEHSSWLEWNVAFPETRKKIIEDIVDNINKLALTFFDKFSDLEKLRLTFLNEGEHFFINRERFLLYFFSKEDLEYSLNTFLTKRDLWEKYNKTLALLNSNEAIDNKNRGTFWHQIAKEVIELDLMIKKTVINNV